MENFSKKSIFALHKRNIIEMFNNLEKLLKFHSTVKNPLTVVVTDIDLKGNHNQHGNTKASVCKSCN